MTDEAVLVGVVPGRADAVPGVNASAGSRTSRVCDALVAVLPFVPPLAEALVRFGAVAVLQVAVFGVSQKISVMVF